MNETAQPFEVSPGTVPDDAAHTASQAGSDHAAGHGADDHPEPLGPADWGAWAGGILGVAAGLLVAVCLWLSTSGL